MPKSLQARARRVFLIRCTLSPLNSAGWKGRGVKFGGGGAGGSPVPFLAARFWLRAEAGSAKARLVLSCDPCEGPPAPGCPSQRRQRWVLSVSPTPNGRAPPKCQRGLKDAIQKKVNLQFRIYFWLSFMQDILDRVLCFARTRQDKG